MLDPKRGLYDTHIMVRVWLGAGFDREHVNRLQLHFAFDLTWGVGSGRLSNSNIADTVRSLFTQVLDFNSLYPTIIQEYNICFTTVQPGTQREDDAVSDACTLCESLLSCS